MHKMSDTRRNYFQHRAITDFQHLTATAVADHLVGALGVLHRGTFHVLELDKRSSPPTRRGSVVIEHSPDAVVVRPSTRNHRRHLLDARVSDGLFEAESLNGEGAHDQKQGS